MTRTVRQGGILLRGTRVPDVVIRRLVIYHRILSEMELGQSPVYISSQELGERAGVSPAQVRKDLASFGEFGKQGVGYEGHYLRDELRSILNLDRRVKVAIVGVGELGTALARYITRRGQRDPGYPFRIAALFDSDPDKAGRQVDQGLVIRPTSEFGSASEAGGIDIAIITVPAPAAQNAAELCVSAGVKAILNFAPAKVFVPADVKVHYSDVSLDLQHLAYYLP